MKIEQDFRTGKAWDSKTEDLNKDLPWSPFTQSSTSSQLWPAKIVHDLASSVLPTLDKPA